MKKEKQMRRILSVILSFIFCFTLGASMFTAEDSLTQKEAIEMFKKSVECNPNYALAHFNLARSIAITGDKIEAAKLYQIAQDINKVTNEIDPQDITDKINALFD